MGFGPSRMLRVLIDSHSFTLRERARDVVLRVGGHPVEREADAEVCIAISEFGEMTPPHAIPTLVCESGPNFEANIVEWLNERSNQTVEPDAPEIPAAPALYANPPYALTYHFVGREQELRDLDRWASSEETAMVYEAIGGMGKSALAWEWLRTHS